mmetsp:Transcript_10498/g.20145  ORF Transcript_10498/g.20145 Transcript_10498/m.20145 type:complete len:81 (-) Transcript_10498:510-752(-)
MSGFPLAKVSEKGEASDGTDLQHLNLESNPPVYSGSNSPLRSDDPMLSTNQQFKFGGLRFLRSSHCHLRRRPSELIVDMT